MNPPFSPLMFPDRVRICPSDRVVDPRGQQVERPEPAGDPIRCRILRTSASPLDSPASADRESSGYELAFPSLPILLQDDQLSQIDADGVEFRRIRVTVRPDWTDDSRTLSIGQGQAIA